MSELSKIEIITVLQRAYSETKDYLDKIQDCQLSIAQDAVLACKSYLSHLEHIAHRYGYKLT